MAPFERDGFHKAECSILLDSVINTARLGTCKLSCQITFPCSLYVANSSF